MASSNPLLDRLVADAAAIRSTQADILTRAAETSNDLDEVTRASFDEAEAQLATLDARIADLVALQERSDAAAAVAATITHAPAAHTGAAVVRSEARTYGLAHPENSYFGDLYRAELKGDREAAARLERHEQEETVERASNTVANLGEFAPAQNFISDYAGLVRSARPVANAIGSQPHPMAPSWTIPVVSQGTSTDYQANELDTVNASTAFDAANKTVVSRTLASYLDASQDMLDFQVGIQLDREIAADLAAVYAQNVETMVLNSAVASNLGLLQVSGVTPVTYTSASPTVALLIGKLAAAEAGIQTARLADPNVIIMAPRRWAWLKSQTDSSGRPLVNAIAPSNTIGIAQGGAEGIVGEFYGYPVITSHAVPLTGGVGTNQDTVILARLSDCRLYEGGYRFEVDRNSLSNKRGVRFVASGYVAFTAERAPAAIGVITGTGLVNPF